MNTATKGTFAIGGVPFSADTSLVDKTLVLRINICGVNLYLT
jgi:hypothetical protein